MTKHRYTGGLSGIMLVLLNQKKSNVANCCFLYFVVSFAHSESTFRIYKRHPMAFLVANLFTQY